MALYEMLGPATAHAVERLSALRRQLMQKFRQARFSGYRVRIYSLLMKTIRVLDFNFVAAVDQPYVVHTRVKSTGSLWDA
jgi:hypothetical protein